MPELSSALLAAVASVRQDQALLVYCDQGGRVSRPVARALRWRGWTVDVLPGGWINYRRWVLAGLEVLPRLVAFRVIAANLQPDHATLARFRRRHQDAVAGLFVQVLALCIAEGLVRSGVVAIDGTKIEADVSPGSSVTRRQIVDEILGEAEAVDAARDAPAASSV